MKFNVGDWVVRTSGSNWDVTQGNIYKVIKTDNTWFYIIKDTGEIDAWWHCSTGWSICKNSFVKNVLKDL